MLSRDQKSDFLQNALGPFQTLDMKKEELDTPIKIPRTTYIISNLL